MRSVIAIAAGLLGAALSFPAAAQENDALARQLSNPIADLISVPFQLNIDLGSGADDEGVAYTLNLQPVVPIRLNEDWNLISRTIIPLAGREDVFAFDSNVWGVSDTFQSFFFSPSRPTSGGLVWGVGPAVMIPTASEGALGAGKWAAGPTAVALTQQGRWTAGVLASHVWSFAGDEDRDDVDQTFVQPFLGYALGRGRTVSAGLEATYDWTHEQWTAPASLAYSQVFAVGGQRMSLQVGARYFLDSPQGGYEWGLRTTLTFLFPRR